MSDSVAVPLEIATLADGPQAVAAWLAAHPVAGLHCGSGVNLQAGWLNTDAMQLVGSNGAVSAPGRLCRVGADRYYLQHDAAQPFPLPDGSLRWIYSEHFIEHLPWPEGLRWLAEMRRLLRSGGTIRISTPDLARYIAGYLDPEQTLFQAQHRYLTEHGSRNVPTRRSFMFNQLFFYWGHCWIYDFDELTHALRQAGFPAGGIVRRAFREGGDPALAALDQAMRQQESLYVEAGRD
ncbi:class I SAM-dependent methyltransferase [Chitinimonas koreensis]|uniref:class I SAM-dependent methyltransferase n=1 Tax=Chitinimonas koreensis TaxID=356302 RepID=UPI00042A570E|nr:methyltransferase domain-containing protein [Chitinimonas koreensis]QNM96174.1 methyltransferase domain-containing protein [Chitinimonas koreensis]